MRRNEPACKAYFVHYQGWSKRFDAWVEEQYVYDFTDENTEMKKQIIQAVKDLKKRVGIFISDHNFRDVINVCDLIILLNQGEVLMQGTPDEVKNNSIAKKFYFGELN